ncbi:MAG: tetratricopeptide repeat protein [Bdellovibrionia bacterium]
MAPSSQQQYKIKLSSGRVLGPIGLDRIRILIIKGQVSGIEVAREHPVGEWADINSFTPIADLLVKKALGTLTPDATTKANAQTKSPLLGATVIVDPGATIPLPSLGKTQSAPAEKQSPASPPKKKPPSPPPVDQEDEKTQVALNPNTTSKKVGTQGSVGDDEKTEFFEKPKPKLPTLQTLDGAPLEDEERPYESLLSTQETILLENPLGKENWGLRDALKDPRKAKGALKNTVKSGGSKVVNILATLSVAALVYMLIDMGGESSSKAEGPWQPIRASVPNFDKSKKDPSKSTKYYTEAMKSYVLDTVPGYKQAAQLLTLAVQYDDSNVKALAMLASSYLNLIDSSNKDENYFSVISKLIELSRANQIELPETVIADVEFYITVNKAEAAQNRIVEYTKSQVHFDTVMFYYLALAFFQRGDAQSAARYVAEYPENKAFSPKLFYLRGQIAEKLGDTNTALLEYEKAIKMTPTHARSRLAIAALLHKTGQLQSGGAHLEYIVKNPRLLGPRDMAQAYYLHAKLSQIYNKDEIALADMIKAAKLEAGNHEYLLELYTLESKLGEDVKQSRGLARMYFFLGEGEKSLKEGDHHKALTYFLQALQANNLSPLPFVKIGDMYRHMNDLSRAMENYQKAAHRAPANIQVWSKYIDTLIQSFEWQKAIEAMEKFRKLDVPQSAIDKAAADMYAKQGDYSQALQYYQRAMARDTVESSVYNAYAKVLMDIKNYKEAPFFFALALRFDPLNAEAIIGTAKCIANTDSLDRAISFLQDELKKGSVARAELLTAIAELYVQKGSFPQAEEFLTQAMAADQNYAYPYKIKARIYMAQENEKGRLDKALEAYKSFSDRNTSDPSGYLERYRIFIKKGEFEKADDELMKIYTIYPKYPNLHFYKGALYSIMGNQQKAVEEYTAELKNNPNSVATLISLGKELVKGGNPVAAITYFNKAMELAPKNSEAKAEGAYTTYLLKNFPGSIALFNAAIRLDPGNAMLYRRLGNTYRDSGDRINATQAYRRYLELYPDAPDRAELQSFLR